MYGKQVLNDELRLLALGSADPRPFDSEQYQHGFSLISRYLKPP